MWLGDDNVMLNGHGRIWAKREGSRKEPRWVVKKGLSGTLTPGTRVFGIHCGWSAGPLQPIVSIVPCCVEEVRMELVVEEGHCSRRSAADTETLLWGHWGIVVGTVGLSVSLRLLCARPSFNHCSWKISLPLATCPQLPLQHGHSLIPTHPQSSPFSFYSQINTIFPKEYIAANKIPIQKYEICLLWLLLRHPDNSVELNLNQVPPAFLSEQI